MRQNVKPLASQYVLVNTAAKTPQAITLGNPLNPAAQQGVGLPWLAWQLIFTFSAAVTWQTTVSRALSSKDVATSKRIYRLNTFHPISSFLLPGLWAIGAYLFFCHHGGLPQGISALTATPEYLRRLLPAGVIGVVIAGMLAAEMSTDSSYILTWATVIYNDLLMPCFRRPLSEKARLLAIRSLVVLIGIFLVFYGLVYELSGTTAFDYISVTGTICVASMFALLIGSVYLPWTNWVGASAAIVLRSRSAELRDRQRDRRCIAADRAGDGGTFGLRVGLWRVDLRLAPGQLLSAETPARRRLCRLDGRTNLMDSVLLWFWTGLFFATVLWWAVMLVRVAFIGPVELLAMFRKLNQSDAARFRGIRRF